MLVEGGSEVHASFIDEEAFQQIILYMAPKIIGGESHSLVGGPGPKRVAEGKQLKFIDVKSRTRFEDYRRSMERTGRR